VRALQQEKAGSYAAPNYLIVDPKTGATLRSRAGAMTEASFLELLSGR
jgi:hypothetical protein